MKVKILKVELNQLAGADIKEGRKITLPSIHDGWNFNFDKHSIRTPYSSTYVLITEETPDVIEGCLIFAMINNEIPHMAFVEVAPHNLATPKRYDLVAGCLIAYAFKLSLIKEKGPYKGYLTFEVGEASNEKREKLIKLYNQKYKARRISDTKLIIVDEDGESLIKEYLAHE